MLIAGERGGSFASRVFLGLGLGGLYTLFQNDNLFGVWPGTPNYEPELAAQVLRLRADARPNTSASATSSDRASPPSCFAGGVFSWLVLMPAIHFFGCASTFGHLSRHRSHLADVAQRSLAHLRPAHGRRRRRRGRTHHPPQDAAHHRRRADRGLRRRSARTPPCRQPERTERDLPMSVVVGGSALLIVLMFLFLTVQAHPRRAGRLARQPRRRAPGRRLRLPLRHRLRAHRRHRRQLRQSRSPA